METIAGILGRALQFHRSGDFAAARDLYQRVLQAEPENADARHLLSLILARVDRRFADALTMIGAVWRGNSQDPVLTANRDSILTQALEHCRETAAECYRETAAERPGWAEIDGVCRAALALRPDVPAFYHLLAQAVFFRNAPDPGPDDAAGIIRQALLQAPNADDNRDGLAQLAETLIDAVRAAPQADPAAGRLPAVLAELTYFFRGVGDWPRLERVTAAALRLNPDDGEAWYCRACIADAAGCYADALEAAARVPDGHPRRAGALLLAAHSCFAGQDFARAEADYRAVLALAPDDAEAAAGVANCVRHRRLAAQQPEGGKIRLSGRVRIVIVTYNDVASLQRNLAALPATLDAPDITVINNHPDPVDRFVPAGVRVLNNALRHPNSRGHLARSWNQALLFGFGRAGAPECDWVIGLQDDLVVSPALWRLFEAERDNVDFMMIGPGDQFWAANLTAVRKIGFWDECLTSIVFQDADYYHRAFLALGERALLADHSHQPPGDCLINNNTLGLHRLLHGAVAADNQARLLRSPPGATHKLQYAYFQKKWGTVLNPHNFHISRDRAAAAPDTFCFYPWFFD
jgi:tetratricopeptide (TPR) repeat protein